MNAKTIKTMRWYKKSLINALTKADIDVTGISNTLDDMIEYLDMQRRAEEPTCIARDAGFLMGRSVGYSDGWDDAMKQYGINDAGMQQRDDHDQHNPRISITEGTFGGYSVYVDHEYICHHSSWDIAMEMGSNYITGRRD